ncbi:hypothetical protein [Peribacillus acanthi]|uniref:hypothetical protein n=1 Tax=Peribacillus acanthi TaxID=2171554 RepID=UPI000D3E4ABF|nr:hypothetical protein [Peribacillus acanthi]
MYLYLMIVGFLIFLALAVYCVIRLQVHFGRDKKTLCNNCSNMINSSQIVCNYCGAFLDKKTGYESKAIRYMEKSVDHKMNIPMEKMGKKIK